MIVLVYSVLMGITCNDQLKKMEYRQCFNYFIPFFYVIFNISCMQNRVLRVCDGLVFVSSFTLFNLEYSQCCRYHLSVMHCCLFAT